MTDETPDQRRLRDYRESCVHQADMIAAYMRHGIISHEISDALTALAALCSEIEDDILLDEGRGPGDPMPGD